MNHSLLSAELLTVHGKRRNLGKPDCSPHPLDIMAIYALYQSRD